MSFSVRITQIHLCDLIQFHNISKIRNSPLQCKAGSWLDNRSLYYQVTLKACETWKTSCGPTSMAKTILQVSYRDQATNEEVHLWTATHCPCNKAALSSSLHPSMTESDWAAYALWKSHSTPTNAPTAQDHHHVDDANQAAPARQGGGLSNAPTEICHPMRRTVQENLRLSLKAPWKP